VSDDIDVTKNFSDVLPHIRGHKWKVTLKEKRLSTISGYGREFELNIRLWRYTNILVSISHSLHERHSASHVKTLVASVTRDAEKLLKITPTRRGYYLWHAQYDFVGNNIWITRADSAKVTDRIEAEEYRYDIKSEDFDDLQARFKQMLESATTERPLPKFITGGN